MRFVSKENDDARREQILKEEAERNKREAEKEQRIVDRQRKWNEKHNK